MESKREFTGVFIPAKIWLDETMIPAEKMLLGEVKALSERTGWCNASNSHFAKWLHCTPQNVGHYIARLKKDGKLLIEYEDNISHQGRKMQVNTTWYHGAQDPYSEAVPPYSEAVPPYSEAVTEIQYKYNLKKENASLETESIINAFDDPAAAENAFWTWFGYKQERDASTWKPRGAKESALKRLYKLSGGKAARAAEIVDYSIGNGYTGLIPERKEQPRAAAPHQAPAVGMRKSVPVYDANGLVTQ